MVYQRQVASAVLGERLQQRKDGPLRWAAQNRKRSGGYFEILILMEDIVPRPLERAPPAELSALQSVAFADYVQSQQLAEVIASEPERRKGIYSALVQALLVHAASQGYSNVRSRHTATNTAVIVAKLKLGFQISGFEYSEVYGPLVQLNYLVGEARRKLYEARAAPIRPAQ